MKEKLVLDEFRLIKGIGRGTFGSVYLAEDSQKRKIALKVENRETSCLKGEYDILKNLQGIKGLPKVYKYIETDKYNIMSMELLSDTLENFKIKGLKPKRLKRLGKKIIRIIRDIHNKGYVHRDIKPDNFALGGEGSKHLHIIDFGMAKQYIKNGKHIRNKIDRNLNGTARYASVNVHLGIEPSRRDDLESVGYMLIYLSSPKKLPWQGLMCNNVDDNVSGSEKDNIIEDNRIRKIGRMKLAVNLDSLCDGIGEFMVEYMEYCRSLKFFDNPDYEYLINLFS